VTDTGAWVLEILDRSGRVQHRLPAGPGDLSLGRAPDNDVVLDDPFVDPHHAVLSIDEADVRLRDLGSLNGTWLGSRRRVDAAALSHGQRVHLGHSVVRLRARDATVPPARRDATSHGVLSAFRRPTVLVLCLLLAIATLALDAWLEETRTLGAGILANQLSYPLLGLLFWAGLWSVINRVVSHRPNFAAHLAIGALALAGLFVADQGVPLVAFALDWHAAAPWWVLGVEILVVGLALFAHLQFISPGRRPVQALSAVAVSAVLIGSPDLGDWLRRDDFSSFPLLDPLLKPPATKMVDGRSVEEFFGDASRFRDELEQTSP